MNFKECRHKWFVYFENCTIHPSSLREMCGNCLSTRTEEAENNLEQLRRLERKVKPMSEGSRRIRTVSQMDSD